MVAAPLALAAVERRAVADRDEDVLQRRPRRRVRVRVAGRDRRHAERLGEVAQRGVAARVAALVRALELDVEAAGPNARRAAAARSGRGRRARARAAGEADEPLVQLLEAALLERRRQQLVLAPGRPRARVRRGQQPAEVRVAGRALDEERDVRAVRRAYTSAPVIGRTPNAFAACANSSEP